MDQLKDLRRWLSSNPKLKTDKKLRIKNKQGYRVLFDGSGDVNKKTAVEMLGKEFNKEVYKVDLTSVVSKYIGETEKNLNAIFKTAESKDAILFFDEAEALFGKRTEVKDSHDRYANIEVSYLLKKIEEYPGVVILSGNIKGNIDEAFIRRFQTVVQFPAKE